MTRARSLILDGAREAFALANGGANSAQYKVHIPRKLRKTTELTTLTVTLHNFDAVEAKLLAAPERAETETTAKATPTLGFSSYEDMHRILAPSRLEIVKALVGQGPLSIREVARRVNRDVQAVHRDVATLINSGVIDRGEKGVEFPYDGIHFEFDITAGKAA